MSIFPTLDFTQIKARYPKGVERITEWLFEQEELKSATSDFVDKKNPEQSKEMFTGLLIQMDPRKLYDIFDSLGICISVFKTVSGGSTEWGYRNGESETYYATSRHNAEVSAFHDAFEILENTL